MKPTSSRSVARSPHRAARTAALLAGLLAAGPALPAEPPVARGDYENLIIAEVLAHSSSILVAQAGLNLRPLPAPLSGQPPKDPIVLTPEDEEKFQQLVTLVMAGKSKLWLAQMKKQTDDLAKLTKLDAAGQAALEAPAAAAIKLSSEAWAPKMTAALRRQVQLRARTPEQLQALFAQREEMAEAMSRQDGLVRDYVRPSDQPAWREAVRQQLNPEQLALWTRTEEERQRNLDKVFEESVKPQLEQVRATLSTLELKCAEIKRALHLPPERAEKLDALAKGANEQMVAEWLKSARQGFMNLDDEQRKSMQRNNGRVMFAVDREGVPNAETIWKEEMPKLLTAEERARWEKIQAEQGTRRAKVLGRMLLSFLDDKVALTAIQREKLLPLSERLMAKQPLFFPEVATPYGQGYSRQSFLQCGQAATDEELKPILDARQLARWRNVCVDEREAMNARRLAVRDAAETPDAKLPPEPEEMEQNISDFLYEKATAVRARWIETLLVKIEDLQRVAGLSPANAARLLTAARGATEETLVNWRRDSEQMVRSNLEGATPQSMRQRLLGLEDYFLQRQNNQPPEKQAVWESTIETELNPAQRAAWQKELDDRRDFREKVVPAAIVAEFDKRTMLTSDQWDQLEVAVGEMIKEYNNELGNYFNGNSETFWYLQPHTRFVPIAGIPEEKLKGILSAAQYTTWLDSREYTNCQTYWNNIRQNHAQRVNRR